MRNRSLAALAFAALLAIAQPAWSAPFSGWRMRCDDPASAITRTYLLPGESICWVHSDDAATANSVAIGVYLCPSISFEYCRVPGDSSAATMRFMAALTDAKANSSPYIGDVDADGIFDPVPATGDCGSNEDGNGVTANDSSFYGISPKRPYFWVEEVNAPGAGNVARVVLTCNRS